MSNNANRVSTRHQVLAALSQLVGLPLTAARRAADMRMLQFGTLQPVDGGSVGEFALHIQCPWRIDGPEGIVTGRMDIWQPVEGYPDSEWDYERSPNLQDFRLDQWFSNNGATLVVERVDADDHGGATIVFGSGFVLRLFPAGTRSEDWRFLPPMTDSPHFVISGGNVEYGDD